MSIYCTEQDLKRNIRDLRSELTAMSKDFAGANRELARRIEELQTIVEIQEQTIKDFLHV